MTHTIFITGALTTITANISLSTWRFRLPERAALITAVCLGLIFMLAAVLIEAAAS